MLEINYILRMTCLIPGKEEGQEEEGWWWGGGEVEDRGRWEGRTAGESRPIFVVNHVQRRMS